MLCQRRQASRIRLRLRVDRQEIVVALEESGDPVLVLGSQDGAGDIDDAPAPRASHRPVGTGRRAKAKARLRMSNMIATAVLRTSTVAG